VISNVAISAKFGAIFRGSLRCLSAIKGLPTVGTGKSTTAITENSARGTRAKFFTALLASAYHLYVRDASGLKQIRIVSPKIIISRRMTRGTQGNKIGQLISFSVVIKKVKRGYMMNRQRFTRKAAILTGIIISFSGLLALGFPIRSSIVSMTTQPSGVVITSPILRGSPFRPTFTATKIMVCNLTWQLFKLFIAGVADNLNSFAPYTNPVNLLPFSITSKATKRILGLFDLIGLTPYLTIALSTVYYFHTNIIARLEHYYK
jgi:hypothetical protein